MSKSSETTQVPNKKHFSESDSQSLDQVLARKPVVKIEISAGPCRHHAKGFCKRRDNCLFLHTQENCPNHDGYNKVCQDKACLLRHPELCKHFLKSQCFFGEKCHLSHPPEASPSIVHSMMSGLQARVAVMISELSNMKKMFVEEQKQKPPDPMEIVKDFISKDDISGIVKDMKCYVKDAMDIIRDSTRKEMVAIRQETKAVFLKISDMQTDHQLKFNNMKKDDHQNFIDKNDIPDIFKDLRHKVKEALKAAKDDYTKDAKDIRLEFDNIKEAFEESKDDIDNVVKEVGHIHRHTNTFFYDISKMKDDIDQITVLKEDKEKHLLNAQSEDD